MHITSGAKWLLCFFLAFTFHDDIKMYVYVLCFLIRSSILLNHLETLLSITRKIWFAQNLLWKFLLLPLFSCCNNVVPDCRYVECTSACIQALTSFRKLYPGHRREEIENCIAKAVRFIEKIQESDGSWFVLPLS